MVMICAQLLAFGRVHRLREEGKEERRRKKARADAMLSSARSKNVSLSAGHTKPQSKENMSGHTPNGKMNGTAVPSRSQSLVTSNNRLDHTGAERSFRDTSEESEVMF